MKNQSTAASGLRYVSIPHRVWLVLLIWLAFALRVYRLDAQSIWWDESLSVYRATRDLGTVLSNVILIQNLVTIDTLPQLYFIFLNLLVRIFGITEFAFRFFSVMANIATLPLIYALARRWANQNVALIATLLATLSPFYVWYSQEARPYTLVLFWSTLTVYALSQVLDSRLTHHDKRESIWLVIYIFSAAAAIYTHYYALFLLPFHGILIAILVRQSPRHRAMIFLPAIPFASILILIPQILTSMTGNTNVGPTFVPLQTILIDLLNSFSIGITANLSDVWWIDAALAGLLIIGIISPLATRNSQLEIWNLPVIILLYLFIPILAVFAASFYRPLYQNSRYLIALSPAFYTGVAVGIITLTHRWKILIVPTLGIFFVGTIFSLNNLYFDPRYGKDDHRGWAATLRANTRPGDFLILDSPHTEELYHYYADEIVPITTLPILRTDKIESPDADTATVREALAKHARVWFLGIHVPFDDPQNRIEKILNAQGIILDQYKFAGTSTDITLSLYTRGLPTVTLKEIGNSLDIEFNGHLHLLGFDAPRLIEHGKPIMFRLYWQIDAPVGEDYAVSVRLVDQVGTIAAQWDTTPVGNRAGTSTWPPNQIIDDYHYMAKPNNLAGVYHIQVVPYHAATGNPLGDVVILADIALKP